MGGVGSGAGRDADDLRQSAPASHETRTKSPDVSAGGAMPLRARGAASLRVGDALIDLERQVLLDADRRPVRLRARAWLVLSHLAARAGHVVGKDELMAAVWSDCVVTDDSLVQAVCDIRGALGPAARASLRTVPRRGYLLMADAEPVEPAPSRTVPVPARDATDRALAAQADRVFVGREPELRRLVDVARGAAPTRVALLHGPGGIGKSMLLDHVKRQVAALGLRVVGLDAALCEPEVATLLAALSQAVGLRGTAATVDELADAWPASPTLLAIDSAERIACLLPLLRDRLLPALPAGTRTVVAGRDPPDARWHAHPRWGLAFEAIALDGLDGADSLVLLERLGVRAALRAQAGALARGHPLALALLAAEAARRGTLPEDLGADVLGLLMQRCVEQVPDAAHRRALQVAAMTERTTETLLARTVPDASPAALYDWLSRQDYVRRDVDGLAVHDLVRDAVTADLRARDPESARALQLAVFSFLSARLRAAPADGPCTAGVARLLRVVPVFRRFFVEGLERYLVDTPGPEEVPALRDFALRGLPAIEHRAFEHWIGHPAARWRVIREDGRRLCGVSCTIALDRLAAADGEADPLVGRVLRTLPGPARGLPRMARFSVPEGERGPLNPSMNALQCAQARAWAATTGLGRWVVASVHPERYADLFSVMRFAPMAGCEVSADGVTVGCYVHDFHAEPWERWFERVTGGRADGVADRPRRARRRAA
jgi:DNA-binding winged helix-turn-helix (wHTH) protein